MRIALPFRAALGVAALALPVTARAMPPMPDMDHGHSAMEMDNTAEAPAPFSPGSGTGRLPAASVMEGLHASAGGWMLMAHARLWGVYTRQSGPRGDDRAFSQSMAMLEASRPLSSSVRLQLRTMLSLDALMGKRGYPLLFATGESAGGRPLVNRQHPHDLFVELSGRIDAEVAPGTRLFVYAGLPGEPALGPSAYMHRGSARLNPEAPIAHHWFDSTHIAFGVATLGISRPHWQLEASAFNGREPDEHRWNIERPRLDSWAARLTWNPAPRWSAQISYGRLESPERLEPGVDEKRLIASVAYADARFAATAGWSRKDRDPGRTLEGAFAEASFDITRRHTLFTRLEQVTNDELFPNPASPLHHAPFSVTKATLGYAYSLPLTGPFTLALGGSGSLYAKSDRLDAAYGRTPRSFTLFARLALGN